MAQNPIAFIKIDHFTFVDVVILDNVYDTPIWFSKFLHPWGAGSVQARWNLRVLDVREIGSCFFGDICWGCETPPGSQVMFVASFWRCQIHIVFIYIHILSYIICVIYIIYIYISYIVHMISYRIIYLEKNKSIMIIQQFTQSKG